MDDVFSKKPKESKMSKEELKEFLYQERILFYNLVRAEFERQTPEERKTKCYDKIAEIIINNIL